MAAFAGIGKWLLEGVRGGSVCRAKARGDLRMLRGTTLM